MWGRIMNRKLFVVLAFASVGLAGPVSAQQGNLVRREAAQELFDQLKGPCADGSKSKACGVLVYSPADCSQEDDPHTRQIYRAYDDGSVRFQNGVAGVARQRPGALLVGVQIFDRKGETTRYVDPQFLSWEAYQAGKKSMPVCGKDARIGVKDFEIPDAVERFLKANP
jgi:hypothetical protein